MKISLVILTFIFSQLTYALSVDTSKSKFQWKAGKITGTFHEGTMALKSSKITTSLGKVTGGTFVIDMAKIDVTDIKGKQKGKFLSHITSKDFFNVKKFPESKLVVNKISDGYLYGKLTIMGKTRPISMPFTQNGKTYSGTLGFDRTDFGIVYGSGNFFKNLGDKVINDTIKLNVSLVLK